MAGRLLTYRIKFKTAGAILAVVQRLLSYNTCLGIQLLVSDIFSWLLHLLGTIELVGSKSRGMLLLTGQAHFCRCYTVNQILLWHLPGNFRIFYCYCQGLSATKKDKSLLFYEKVKNYYFFVLKVTNRYFFALKIEKLLIFLVKENKTFTDTDWGTPFTCRGMIMIPGQPLSFC